MRRAGQLALEADISPALVQPLPQPAPLAQQSFVSHLHGGAAGSWVVVEREQTVSREGVDHPFHQLGVSSNRQQFSALNPPAGVFDALSQRHQP